MNIYKDRHLPTPPDPGLGAIRMRALRALGAVDRTRVQMSWREGRRQRADAERFEALRELQRALHPVDEKEKAA